MKKVAPSSNLARMGNLFRLVIATLALAPLHGFADTIYLDTNASSGSNDLEDSVWTLDPTGQSGIDQSFVSGDAIVFSTGPNASGTQQITVSDPTPLTINGITINEGTVSLNGLGGPPNVTLGTDGITMNSNDGPFTLDLTQPFAGGEGILTLGGSQNWDDNSTRAINVISPLTSTVNSTISFNGTGTGATTISGQITGNIGIVQNSTTSQLNLTYANSNGNIINTFTGGTTVNGGTISLSNSGDIGGNGSALTLNNGGTVNVMDTTGFHNFNHAVTLTGTGGALNFSADTLLGGTFTGTSLTLGSGDDLITSTGNQSIGTLNLVGNGTINSANRLILSFGNGGDYGFINGSTINVSNGYILDFGGGVDFTANNVINFASGTALEIRNGHTITFTNAQLPTAGTFTLGSDDAGSGTINIESPLGLTGDLTLDIQGGSPSAVFLSGPISGNHNLNITSSTVNPGGYNPSTLFLAGTNTYTGSTTINGAPNEPVVVDVTGDSSGIGTALNVEFGTLQVGLGGILPTASVVTIGNGSTAGTFLIGDSSGATSVTVGSILAGSTNPNSDLISNGSSATSNLTVDVTSGDDTYNGGIGGNLTITKEGAGSLTLTNTNFYTGNTYINGGTLVAPNQGNGGNNSSVGAYTIDGSGNYSSFVEINNGATLSLPNGAGFTHEIVLNTPGLVNIGGIDYNIAGQLAGQLDNVVTGPFNGGGGLAVVSGDILVEEQEAGTPGAVYILNSGTRVLLLNNLDFVSGATSVNIGTGGNLDFGTGGSPILNVPLNLASGAVISDRSTNATITDLNVPTTGSGGAIPDFYIGSDDLGGGSITVQNEITLSSDLDIIVNRDINNPTAVTFQSNFTGTGNLSFSSAFTRDQFNNPFYQDALATFSGTNSYTGDTTVDSGTMVIKGDNTGVTSAGGGAPNYIVQTAPLDSTVGVGGIGILQIGAGGSLASNAHITIGDLRGFSFFELGDGDGAVNQTIGSLTMPGNAGDNGAVVGGSSSISYLTINLAPGVTDVYNGLFGNTNGNQTAFNNFGNRDNLGVIFDIGTGAKMVLGGFQSDNIAGGFVVNGGILEVTGGNPLGTSATSTTLNNVELLLANNGYSGGGPQSNFILGTGTNSIVGNDGIDNFSGSVQSGAGSVLHISGPNLIISPNSNASSIGTLDIDGGRIFLLGNNALNFLAGNTTVNVASGAILDFATSTTFTSDNLYNFSNGSGLTIRPNGGSPTNVTLTDVALPTSGNFEMGSDDVGNQGGSVTITSNLALTGDFTLRADDSGGSTVVSTLSGNITGLGNFTEDAGDNGPGILVLSGANSYSGSTTVTGGTTMKITGNSTATGNAYNIRNGLLDIGTGGSISSGANVTEGDGGSNSGALVLGDANGAVDQTLASLTTNGGSNDTVYNGNIGSTDASALTVDVTGGTDTYSGTIGNDSTTNGNLLSFTKSGAGNMVLSGNNTYTGGTTVQAGRLSIDGSIAGNVAVNLGAQLGGHGKIAGSIGGAGTVGPGNSPGILTAASVDPSGGTSFNFEFTLTGAPNYGNAAASGNDVLHLNGATPFAFALTRANAVNLYFASAGTGFEGGFFTNGDVDTLTGNITNATYTFYILDNTNGAFAYNGNRYDLTTGTESVVAVSGAAFGDGTTDGFTEQFTADPASVPEPSTYALMGLGLLGFVSLRKFRKNA